MCMLRRVSCSLQTSSELSSGVPCAALQVRASIGAGFLYPLVGDMPGTRLQLRGAAHHYLHTTTAAEL